MEIPGLGINDANPLQGLIGQMNDFLDRASQGGGRSYFFAQSLRLITGAAQGLLGTMAQLTTVMSNQLAESFSEVSGYFQKLITDAIDFDLSITGLLQQAERTRKFYSELADEMNFFSSSTGSTTQAMGMLMRATSKSAVGYQTLKNAFNSMVDAGADSKQFIEDMLPLLGDFEVKTGVGIQQFATMSTKFEQMFGEKKGITKDIQDLQKALIGTGLKGSQLEQTMQGLTEAAEKLGFATQGATLNIKELSKSYGQTAAVFKAFGINTQTTSNFLNGLVDPENIEKNMLLMNKMGVSYQEFNDMLNSGQGQDKFFDKIINNVGKVAQEANLIQDASTRYKYLKDTLGLPPEIANKLMKVTPSRMQAELRKIKREMEEAEKKEKWRKELKQREEKYEEAMMFLRMEMVAPLVGLITRNRGAIMRIMRSLVPVFQLISEKLAQFLDPFSEWLEKIAGGVDLVMSRKLNIGEFIDFVMTDFMKNFGDSLKALFDEGWFAGLGEDITSGFLSGASKALGQYYTDLLPETVQQGIEMTKNLVGRTGSDTAESALGLATSEQQMKMSGLRRIGIIANQKRVRDIIEKESKGVNQNATNLTDDRFKFSADSQRAFNQLNERIKEGNVTNTINDILLLKQRLLEQNEKNKGGQEGEKQIQEYIDRIEKNLLGTESTKTMNSTNQTIETYMKNKLNNKKGIKTPVVKFNKEATSDIQTITNSSTLSNDEVQAAVGRLMNDQGFMATVSSALVSVKDKRINELETQVNTFLKTEKALREEFDALKNESTNGILIKWQDEFFGDKEDSIRNILLRMDDSLSSDEKNKKILGKNMTVGNEIGILNNIVKNKSSSLTASIAGSSDLLQSAGSVRNLQVRQSIYLKSIAESTLDSAKYLKFIGTNLVFTEKGLAVAPNYLSNAKLMTLSGKPLTGNEKTVSGFGVISASATNTASEGDW
jgi:hypothetical protein